MLTRHLNAMLKTKHLSPLVTSLEARAEPHGYYRQLAPSSYNPSLGRHHNGPSRTH